jgi:hypothetical protein
MTIPASAAPWSALPARLIRNAVSPIAINTLVTASIAVGSGFPQWVPNRSEVPTIIVPI